MVPRGVGLIAIVCCGVKGRTRRKKVSQETGRGGASGLNAELLERARFTPQNPLPRKHFSGRSRRALGAADRSTTNSQIR